MPVVRSLFKTKLLAFTLATCSLVLSQTSQAAILDLPPVGADIFTVDQASVYLLDSGSETVGPQQLNNSLSHYSYGNNLEALKISGFTSFLGFKIISTGEFIMRWSGTTNVELLATDVIELAGNYNITLPAGNSVSSSLHFFMADTPFNPNVYNGYTDNFSDLSTLDPNTGALATSLFSIDGLDTHAFTFNHSTPLVGNPQITSWAAGTFWQLELTVQASLAHGDRIVVSIPSNSIDFALNAIPAIPEPASISLLTLASLALLTRRRQD